MAQCQSKVGKVQCDLQEHESGDHALCDDKGNPMATWSDKKTDKPKGQPWTR